MSDMDPDLALDPKLTFFRIGQAPFNQTILDLCGFKSGSNWEVVKVRKSNLKVCTCIYATYFQSALLKPIRVSAILLKCELNCTTSAKYASIKWYIIFLLNMSWICYLLLNLCLPCYIFWMYRYRVLQFSKGFFAFPFESQIFLSAVSPFFYLFFSFTPPDGAKKHIPLLFYCSNRSFIQKSRHLAAC